MANSTYYEQVSGAAMGSPISPVIVDIIHATARTYHEKSHIQTIKFTTEILPFLDVLVIRKPDGTLGHKVYRKPIAYHLIPSPITKEHITKILIQNGLNKHCITKMIRKSQQNNRTQKPMNNTHTVFLPYIKDIIEKIGKTLRKHKIGTVFSTESKIKQVLTSSKDPISTLESSGVYKVLCSCEAMYIGETRRSKSTRLKEHERCIKLGYVQLTIVEHHKAAGHNIKWEKAKVIAKTTGYFSRKDGVALEIRKHLNNINRDMEYQLYHI
ncbi:PREDICTED: uncharacterized protein LOC108579016 [Habropoda laboriosa]|uniref:uncharacterized protein LOC108579016 n=1 Tax=Habropoda laboriosa TaxID=597456 RepID=UPI00083CA826|nr:PREDICTED: uncharacterized protein LOC108579016 [Habropoda laboriosa]